MNYISLTKAILTALRLYISGSETLFNAFKVSFTIRSIINELITKGYSMSEISVALEREFDRRRDLSSKSRDQYKN